MLCQLLQRLSLHQGAGAVPRSIGLGHILTPRWTNCLVKTDLHTARNTSPADRASSNGHTHTPVTTVNLASSNGANCAQHSTSLQPPRVATFLQPSQVLALATRGLKNDVTAHPVATTPLASRGLNNDVTAAPASSTDIKYAVTAPSVWNTKTMDPQNEHRLLRHEENYLEWLHRIGPPRKLRKLKPLDGRPQMKGVVLKTLIKKPKKPNSANRKCVLVRLSSGKELVAYVPGEGHNLQEHSIVLVRGGRLRDTPGVKIKVVRGAYDCAHVMKKTPLNTTK